MKLMMISLLGLDKKDLNRPMEELSKMTYVVRSMSRELLGESCCSEMGMAPKSIIDALLKFDETFTSDIISGFIDAFKSYDKLQHVSEDDFKLAADFWAVMAAIGSKDSIRKTLASDDDSSVYLFTMLCPNEFIDMLEKYAEKENVKASQTEIYKAGIGILQAYFQQTTHKDLDCSIALTMDKLNLCTPEDLMESEKLSEAGMLN